MNIKFKSQKGISIKTLVIIVAVIIVLFFIFFNSKGGYKLSSEYSIAYAGLNRAISQSTVDGTGIIERQSFNKLGTLVKNYKSSSQWFGGSKSIYSGKITTTSDGVITQVTDGTYVATFTMKYEIPNNKMSDYILVDYTFENKSIQGYRFTVE